MLEANGQTTTTIELGGRAGSRRRSWRLLYRRSVGQSVTLQSTGNQRVKNFTWDFGDGTVVSDTDSTVSHVYATAGTYQARLVVADSVGCSVCRGGDGCDRCACAADRGVDAAGCLVCLGKGVTIKAIGGVSYSWSPGISLSDSTDLRAGGDAFCQYRIYGDGSG